MTGLQSSIIAALKISQPMTDGDLWRYCRNEEQGKSYTLITVACNVLETARLIIHTDHGWMLTTDGQREANALRANQLRPYSSVISNAEKSVDLYYRPEEFSGAVNQQLPVEDAGAGAELLPPSLVGSAPEISHAFLADLIDAGHSGAKWLDEYQNERLVTK